MIAIPPSGIVTADEWREVHQRAVLVARTQIGQGEEGANNIGPVIDMYSGNARRWLVRPSWCALFVGWCLAQAAMDLDVELPFKRSASAKKLAAQVAKVGRWVVGTPDVGDLVVWHRGRLGSSKGHIGIVTHAFDQTLNGTFQSIEGNVGAYPSTVREYVHPYGDHMLLGFVRLY